MAGVIGAVALMGISSNALAYRAHSASTTVVKSHRLYGAWVLAASNGHTLYGFTRDFGHSTCYGSCAKVWHPLIDHGRLVAGAHVNAKKLKTVKRKNGQLQVTYYGHPLYLYTGDTKPGQAKGEYKYQFGGQWYAVNVNGSPQPPPGY